MACDDSSSRMKDINLNSSSNNINHNTNNYQTYLLSPLGSDLCINHYLPTLDR